MINVLLFLNKDWSPEWNGNLEFWDKDTPKVLYTHEDISESGGWCSPNAKYFVNWKIKIF